MVAMVNNQSGQGQGAPDVTKVIGTDGSDAFLITVIVIGSVLFIVIIAIIAVMISSTLKIKKPVSEASIKNYRPGSAKRHYLATPQNKVYLLKKYTRVPYMVGGQKTQGTAPVVRLNPVYEGRATEHHEESSAGDKSVVGTQGGSPTGLSLPDGDTARSVTSDLLDQLKTFQHMRTMHHTPL